MSTKNVLKFVFAALSAGALLCACASVSSSSGLTASDHPQKIKYNEKRFNAALERGDFTTCAGMLLGQNVNANDVIRQNLDIAMLEHYAKAFDASDEICGKTDRLMHDAVTKSISKTVVSATLNENASEYTGTVYEYLYINVFNALNYYNRGNMEDALVEIRKINNKQREYITKYGEAALQKDQVEQKDITDADYAARFFGINVPALKTKSPPSATEADVFRDSATARYLSMLFMMMDDDAGNARVDSDVLAKLNPGFDTKSELGIPEDKGRLDIIAFSGLIGRRFEQTLYFPGDVVSGVLAAGTHIVGNGPESLIMLPPLADGVEIPAFRIKFVYPNFKENAVQEKTASVRIVMDDGSIVQNLPLLENFNDAVAKDVRVRASRDFGRSVIRSLVKKMSAVAAGEATLSAAAKSLDLNGKNKSFGEDVLSRVAYNVAYAGVVTAIEAVDLAETADVRQCRYLPGKSNAGGITLAPGMYSFTVQYLDSGGKILGEQKFNSVEVQAGKPVLVESVCIK
ncbi:MAG: hypothetical protein M0P01_13300 [Treponema sp.]|nr:hypothetical protein [Treponema sp.]